MVKYNFLPVFYNEKYIGKLNRNVQEPFFLIQENGNEIKIPARIIYEFEPTKHWYMGSGVAVIAVAEYNGITIKGKITSNPYNSERYEYVPEHIWEEAQRRWKEFVNSQREVAP